MLDRPMTHAKITPAVANVHAAHPFRSKANHEKLLDYLQQRLQLGKDYRDAQLPRYVQMDKQIAGWMRLSEQDKKRAVEKARNGTPGAMQVNLPLTFVHLDDMMTYFAQTFSPNRGMFYHTGKPDEVTDATQVVTLMNNHAIYAGMYRETLLSLFSLLKYNIGGFYCYWSKDSGPRLTRDSEGNDFLKTEVKWQGNKLESLDMYNTFFDPSVHPTKVHLEGEFVARARLRSHFWLLSRAAEGRFFNVEAALKQDTGVNQSTYYRHPPTEAAMVANDANGTDWVSILSEAPIYSRASGFELVDVFIKLNPVEFGLIDGTRQQRRARARYETWRFTILDNKYIIDATYLNNIHGYLPMFFGRIHDDLMEEGQKSVGEIISPLQDFASFLLNTHVQATRRNIWGLTVYDKSVVDLGSIPPGEVSAVVPIRPSGYGKDIRQSIWTNSNTLDTKQTMRDLDSTMAVINQFFPTQSLPSQIASIDRAVTSQVAAVQQGANRRMQKTARLLDDSLFRNIRFAMYYNIIQYQPDNTTVNDFYGREVKIDLNSLRNTDLPFIIGQGLKALDRQASASALQDIIFALIQSPQAQNVDLMGMIDYWTSMLDIDLDMTQFIKQAQAQVAPAQPTPQEGAA